jgi:transposase
VHEDEASFRQSPTLHQTWAPRGAQPQIPSRGQRNTQKILGGVDIASGKFIYRHQQEYFNAETYIDFLEEVLLPGFYRRGHRVYLIQDNASYHKKPEVYEWFGANRKRVEVNLLPSYSPEFNAVERIWNYTRKHSTHNRYFDTVEELCESLFDTFTDIQEHPENILGLLNPFC